VLELATGVEHREDDLGALCFVLGWTSTGMPRPSSLMIDAPSSWRVTPMLEANPFMASSTALSTISHTR
jgi:hypothetical protein